MNLCLSLLFFRCHVNICHWTQWRNGLFVSTVETRIQTFLMYMFIWIGCPFILPQILFILASACTQSYIFSLFSRQSVSSCAMRCWTAMLQRCLCGSWLCRAPPASVCSGMKSSTSTRLQRTCLWTSEGKSIEKKWTDTLVNWTNLTMKLLIY